MVDFKDGGPAFPVTIGAQHDQYFASAGMSLRDYFAGQAMGNAFYDAVNNEEDYRSAAQRAYEFADAMLEASASLLKAEGGSNAS